MDNIQSGLLDRFLISMRELKEQSRNFRRSLHTGLVRIPKPLVL